MKRPFRLDGAELATQFREEWEPRDRALFHELLFGLIRWHGRITWLLEKLSRRGLDAPPAVFSAAAIGLYQILFLDRIPDHAAVDTSVELARRAGGERAADWVNAVLRKVAGDPDYWRAAAPDKGDAALRLSILHSHPWWMVARWMRVMPPIGLKAFLEWNNRRPQPSLRIDRRRITAADAIAELKALGLDAVRSSLNEWFITVQHGGDPSRLAPIAKGWAVAQDVSQGFVSLLVDPRPGTTVLDLCAAPGGKTGHLAELCPDCRITATDKEPERLQLVGELVKSKEYLNVNILPYQEMLDRREQYDTILVDAPCTGTGVLARRPDLRWQRTPADVARMAQIQLQLLQLAANRLSSGGAIIYSTCSVETEENKGLVDRFLQQARDFRIAPADGYLPKGLVDEAGCYNIRGPETSSDGAFAVRLERKRTTIADSGKRDGV